MTTDISPPPTKRVRLNNPPNKAETLGGKFTLYSWNVNGIAPFIQQSITSFFKTTNSDEAGRSINGSISDCAGASLRTFLRRHGWPSLLFLQEVKINPDDTLTLAAVESAVRRRTGEDADSPSYRAHFCLPGDKHNARGFGRKVYGVCSIIREDFYERFVTAIRPVSWDQEGRFLVVEMRAADRTPKLAIFNVYAVNGTHNAYNDPQTGEPSGTRHGRKLRVHALLQAECRRLESEGFSCVIAGDINIARAAIDGYPNLRTFPRQHCLNRADFEARFIAEGETAASTGEQGIVGLGMIDTFRHLHPQQRGYTYYPRTRKFGDSCDRVDMMLISKSLTPFLEEAGMHETAADRGTSDHVPLYTTFNFELGGEEDEGEVKAEK